MIREFQGEYRWLSNFWPAQISYKGIRFNSAESAFVSAKTGDQQVKLMISKMTAAEAKKYGRRLTLVPDWHKIKIEVMLTILRIKFSDENSELKTKLIETGSEILEEGNYWGDTFWGVDSRTRQGQNWLGTLLMQVRKEIS